MSAKLTLTVTCDGCNRTIGTAEAPASATGFAKAGSDLWMQFRRKRVMDIKIPWRKTEHYCRECADGVPSRPNDGTQRQPPPNNQKP